MKKQASSVPDSNCFIKRGGAVWGGFLAFWLLSGLGFLRKKVAQSMFLVVASGCWCFVAGLSCRNLTESNKKCGVLQMEGNRPRHLEAQGLRVSCAALGKVSPAG